MEGFKNLSVRGAWGAQSASDFGSGHDLTVRGFKPGIGLCADSLEPGACFGFCVSFSLCSSPAHALSPSLSKINKDLKNLKVNKIKIIIKNDGWQKYKQTRKIKPHEYVDIQS